MSQAAVTLATWAAQILFGVLFQQSNRVRKEVVLACTVFTTPQKVYYLHCFAVTRYPSSACFPFCWTIGALESQAFACLFHGQLHSQTGACASWGQDATAVLGWVPAPSWRPSHEHHGGHRSHLNPHQPRPFGRTKKETPVTPWLRKVVTLC